MNVIIVKIAVMIEHLADISMILYVLLLSVHHIGAGSL